MGDRQGAPDDELTLVYGPLGEAAVVDGYTYRSTDRPVEALGMEATAAPVRGIRHDGVEVLRSGGRVGRDLPPSTIGGRGYGRSSLSRSHGSRHQSSRLWIC